MQTFTPREYLKIDISNNFGNDKLNWADRIKWFDDNEAHLMSLLDKAETPALYYAGVQAWNQVKQGKAIGYPIGLDATASGLQLMACLTRDIGAACLCNVVDTGQREDAYNRIYQHMLRALGEGSQLKREDTKSAVMTSLYGSQAIPKQVFGEGSSLLQTFYNSMNTLAPRAWELNKTFLDIWRNDVDAYSWVLPDNFHVHVKVMKPMKDTVHFLNGNYDVVYKEQAPTEHGRSIGANVCHSLDGFFVREIGRRCMYDKKQVANVERLLFTCWQEPDSAIDPMCEILWNHYLKSGFLSARILDHINEDTVGLVDREVILALIESLPQKPFQVISIHDCFRVLPNYGNDIRKQYNNLLAMLAKSNMLEFILSQYLEREISLSLGNDDLWESILNADYALS